MKTIYYRPPGSSEDYNPLPQLIGRKDFWLRECSAHLGNRSHFPSLKNKNILVFEVLKLNEIKVNRGKQFIVWQCNVFPSPWLHQSPFAFSLFFKSFFLNRKIKKKKIEILFSFLNFIVSLLHDSYNLCPYFRLISPVVTCCTFSQSRVGNSDRSLFLCRTFLHFLWLPHHNHTLKKKKGHSRLLGYFKKVITIHTSRITSGLENNTTVNFGLGTLLRAFNSQAKISYRCLTEINSRRYPMYYNGLSLMRTLTQGHYSVHCCNMS